MRLAPAWAAPAGTAWGNPIGLPDASVGAAGAILRLMLLELSPLHGATLLRTAAPPQKAAPAGSSNTGDV